MLQAPTKDRQNKSAASSKTAEQLLEQDRNLPWPQQRNLATMQKTYGNQALLRIQGRSPKSHAVQGGFLQRKWHIPAGGERKTSGIKSLQKRAIENQSEHTSAPPIVHSVLHSSGSPLDAKTREFMEPRFAREFMPISAPKTTPLIPAALAISHPDDDYEQEAERKADSIMGAETTIPAADGWDFSQVRIHTDARAAESTSAVNALAYTVGNNIVFGSGQYAPETTNGRRLLAHELTHVVQQRGAVQQPMLARAALTTADFNALAEALHNAMDRWGTDEEAIYSALQKIERDPAAIRTLRTTYQTRFGKDLETEIRDEMSGSELDFALELLGIQPRSGSAISASPPNTPSQFEAAARRLDAAMDILGTDEEAIYATLLPLNHDQGLLMQLKTTYQRLIGRSLEDDIRDEMSGNELAYALYLLNAPPSAAPQGSFQTVPGSGTPPAKVPPAVEGGQVSVLTGANYPTSSGGTGSVTFAVAYQGGLAADTRWLQFIWREVEVTAADGTVSLLSDPVTIGARTYSLTTNQKSPIYSVDSRSATDPFYEASTSTARREPDLTLIADAPTPLKVIVAREFGKGASGVVSRAHFEIYLIRDYRTLYHVGIDIEHPFRNASSHGTIRSIRVTETVTELPSNLRTTLIQNYPTFSYIQ
jgi:Domain of unknown function (DUF4157)/Annexin